MANRHIWTRNYWNLFCEVYGVRNGAANVTTTTPNHNKPYFTDPSGLYRGAYNFIQNGVASSNQLERTLTMKNCYTNYAAPSQQHNETNGQWSYKIILGSGDGELNENEYNLFNPILSNMSIGTISYTQSYDENTHGYTITTKIPVVYTGSGTISIKEYGLFGFIPISAWSGNDYSYMFDSLMYHEVFDEAIVLEQNDTIEITFNQTIIQPHYSEYPPTS